MTQVIESPVPRKTCDSAPDPGACLLQQLAASTSAELPQQCVHCDVSVERLEAEVDALGGHLAANGGPDELDSECRRALAGAQALDRIQADLSTHDNALDPSATDKRSVPRAAELTEALSGYRVIEQIGLGGMGAVYRAVQLDLKREVALKVLQTDSRRTRDELAARFQREAHITARLDHPSICPVYNTGLDNQGRCWYTMRLVRGRDLKDIVRLARDEREGWDLVRGVAVLVKICQAMASAHSKGAVHRDLKPSNVMVGEHHDVYVMDWGLARMADDEDDSLDALSRSRPVAASGRESDEANLGATEIRLKTMDGAVIGTPAYMPPEQARGDIHLVDHLADIYSLGAILYELLTGRPPYMRPGKPQSTSDFLRAISESAPEPVTSINSRALPELVTICWR